MTPDSTPTFETVDNALRALGAGEGATEAHGSLCGLTCVLGLRARVEAMIGRLKGMEHGA